MVPAFFTLVPGRGGVARRLRKISATTDTFILALSGYGTEEDRMRAHEAGFNYHLTKPVAPEVLFELLSRTLAPS
jgi:CheY-like chemotaxis protein